MFEHRLEQLRVKLLERGYRPKMINNAFDKVRSITREEALKKVVRIDENEGRVRAIFQFDMRLPNLSSIFIKHWKIMISEDVRLKDIYPKPPMVVYRRSKNLVEKLCTAKLPPLRLRLRQDNDGFRRCNKPGCRMCPLTGLQPDQVLRTVRIEHSDEQVEIRGKLNCKSSNLLYVVSCKKGPSCKENNQYVGETGKSAEVRCSQHRDTIVQNCHLNTSKPVGEHFRGPGHSISNMVFTPVEKIFSENVFVRKAREKQMINKYDMITYGLNKNL